MDPASTPLHAAHGENNLYHGIVLSSKAYNSPTPAHSTQSGSGFCLWEQHLCYSEVEEESGVQYHPGYIIFYPTAVLIIPIPRPVPRTFSFQRAAESTGTGVFHPLSSVPSTDGNFLHQSQCNHPRAQKITGALYLTEAATYTIGRHFCPLASPCENRSVGGLEGASGEQNQPSLKTTGALGGEQGERNWLSSSPKPAGVLENDSGVQNSASSFQETTYANALARSLPSSTSDNQVSSKSWKAQETRNVHGNKDQQDQPAQDNLPYESPLGSKPITERLGDPITSSSRTKDNKWSSGQSMLTVDGSYQITPSVLSANKGKSQIVAEIEKLLTEERNFDLIDEEIKGKDARASVELEDPEYGGTKVCHLQCQIERALCAHPCGLPSHPGNCPPCKALVKQDCHCKALVHSFSCDQFTSASEIELERMCSCGGFCHKRLPNCAHMCSDICHARPCQPSNCRKKVMLRCKCQRFKKAWLCYDLQEAKMWGESFPTQKKRYQLGEYIGLIACDKECLLSVEMKETKNEAAAVQRNAEETEVDKAGLAIPRKRWSFTSKVAIVLLAILLILGLMLFGHGN